MIIIISVLKKFVEERKKSSKSSNKKGDIHIVYLLILENRENKVKEYSFFGRLLLIY